MGSGIKYTSEVLNQRGAPALFEDILTNRPAAGFVGRLFFATDVTSGSTIFRDNGTTWDALAGNGGGGGGVTSLSNGLTLTGSNGTLGGTLTSNTTIEGDGSYSLTLNSLTTFNGYANTVNIGRFGSGQTLFTIDSANTDFIFNNGTVLIGTTTDLPSSIFTVESTTKGALLPRMSTTLRNAITSPATGLLVYDTTLLNLYQYNGTAWAAVGGGTSTNIYNTDGSLTAARTLTLNSQTLTIAGTTSTRFFANGNVGIGTTTDAGYKLAVIGSTRIEANAAGLFTDYTKSGTLHFSTGITGGNQPYIYSPISGLSAVWTNNCLQLYRSGTPTYFASAIFEVFSTTQGVLLPRMTTAQINAITTPAEGLIIYNTTLSNLCCYQAGVWVKFSHSPM